MEEREQGRGNERWSAAIANLSEISNNLDSLGNLLIKKAVYVDEDTFNKASLTSDQARNIKVSFCIFESFIASLERTTCLSSFNGIELSELRFLWIVMLLIKFSVIWSIKPLVLWYVIASELSFGVTIWLTGFNLSINLNHMISSFMQV